MQTFNEPKVLGVHAETNDEVSIRKGPYGFYVQLGEQGEKNSEKQTNQREIIKQFYPNSDEEILFDNLYEYDIASQAFCFLLNLR